MEIKSLEYNDDYFMDMAEKVSTFSTCRRQVGAVIVKDNVILTTGYNDAPIGLPTCSELGGCIRQRDGILSGTMQEHCRAVHAEQRAIIQAATTDGISIKGGTLYVTTYPCGICARMIIDCKLERIVYKGDYQDKNGQELLSESGIIVEKYEPKKKEMVR